jgi:hypothetical protein
MLAAIYRLKGYMAEKMAAFKVAFNNLQCNKLD